MSALAEVDLLPSPYQMAKNIKLQDKKYNGYPYLIQALLSEVPELRQFSDDEIIQYHHSVRHILHILRR